MSHNKESNTDGQRVVEEEANVVGAAKQGMDAPHAIWIRRNCVPEQEILHQPLQGDDKGRSEQREQQTSHILPGAQTIEGQQQVEDGIKNFFAEGPQGVSTRISDDNRNGGGQHKNEHRKSKEAEPLSQFAPR